MHFRLNVFPIDVPSLSDRSDDIPEIIEHFIQRKITKGGLGARPVFEASALEAFKSYAWPGNVREVRNVIERAMVFFPRGKISGQDVNTYLLKTSSEVVLRTEEQDAVWDELDKLSCSSEGSGENIKVATNPPSPNDFASWFNTNNSVDLRALLRDIEIVLIQAAMDRNNGNTSEAARDLKLLRTTLIEKVKKYGI